MKEIIKHESTYIGEGGYEILLLRQYQTNKYKDKKVIKSVPDGYVELGIFTHYPLIKSWREQLRWIWQVLVNKAIWSDQIIIDLEAAERLGNTLISLAKEAGDGKEIQS